MKKVLKKFNRTLSIMLAAAMVLTMLPQTAMPVLAQEEGIEAQAEKPADDAPAAEENESEPSDVGETENNTGTPDDGQNPEVTETLEGTSDQETYDQDDPDTEGDEITSEDPSDETSDETPTEDAVGEEAPAQEDAGTPAEEVTGDTVAEEEAVPSASTLSAADADPQAASLEKPVITVKDGDQQAPAGKARIDVPNGDTNVTFELVAAEGAPEGVQFYYTTDGSEPTKESTKYGSGAVAVSAPESLAESTVTIRAIAYIPASGEGETAAAEQTSEAAAFDVVFSAKLITIDVHFGEKDTFTTYDMFTVSLSSDKAVGGSWDKATLTAENCSVEVPQDAAIDVTIEAASDYELDEIYYGADPKELSADKKTCTFEVSPAGGEEGINSSIMVSAVKSAPKTTAYKEVKVYRLVDGEKAEVAKSGSAYNIDPWAAYTVEAIADDGTGYDLVLAGAEIQVTAAGLTPEKVETPISDDKNLQYGVKGNTITLPVGLAAAGKTITLQIKTETTIAQLTLKVGTAITDAKLKSGTAEVEQPAGTIHTYPLTITDAKSKDVLTPEIIGGTVTTTDGDTTTEGVENYLSARISETTLEITTEKFKWEEKTVEATIAFRNETGGRTVGSPITVKVTGAEGVKYAEKITLKKKNATVYTGQETVVATVDFGKDTFNRGEDVEIYDIPEYFTVIVGDERYTRYDGGTAVLDDSLQVKVSVAKGAATGKYTIKARTRYGGEVVQATASMPVTVVRGIEEITAASTPQIYKQDGKDGTAKITVAYNAAYADAKSGAPKTKKVTYVLGRITEDGFTEDSAVLGSKVTVKNGTVTVMKDYVLNTATEKNRFAVVVRAADYAGNETESLPLEFEVIGDKAEYGSVVLLDEDGVDCTPADKGNIAINKLKELHVAVVAAGASKDENGKYPDDKIVDPSLYTLTPAKGNVFVDGQGCFTVNKLAKNVEIKAAAKDGSKANAKSVKFNVTYDETPGTELENLKVYYRVDYDGEKGHLSDTQDKIALDSEPTGTVIHLSVTDRGGAALSKKGSIFDCRLAVNNCAKTVKKSADNLELDIVMTRNPVIVTLSDSKGANKRTFTITNKNFEESSPVPTVTLKKGVKLYQDVSGQQLSFTMKGAVENARYVVISAQNTETDTKAFLERLTSDTVALNPAVQEFTFTCDDGKMPVLKKGASVAFTFLDRDKKVLRKTTKALSLKTAALKKSYKLTAKYTMSETDAASVALTGKSSAVTDVQFTDLYNANIKGAINKFKTGFSLDEEHGRLRLMTDEKGVAVARGWVDENNRKLADYKNDWIGFVGYTVTYEDGSKEELVSRIEVSLAKKDKTARKYAATAVNVLNATGMTGTTYVTVSKLPVDIKAAYAVPNDGKNKDNPGAFNVLEVNGVEKVEGNAVTLAIKQPANNKATATYKGDLYFIPEDSLYANADRAGWGAADWEQKGVKVALTVNVKAPSSKGKIKIAAKSVSFLNAKPEKLALDGTFKEYYYAEIPYTTAIYAGIDRITLENANVTKADPKTDKTNKLNLDDAKVRIKKVNNKEAFGVYIDAAEFQKLVNGEKTNKWSGAVFSKTKMTVYFEGADTKEEFFNLGITMPNPWAELTDDDLTTAEKLLERALGIIRNTITREEVDGIKEVAYSAIDKTLTVTADDASQDIETAVPDETKDKIADALLADEQLHNYVDKLDKITVTVSDGSNAASTTIEKKDGTDEANKQKLLGLADQYTERLVRELASEGKEPVLGSLVDREVTLTLEAVQASGLSQTETCTVQFKLDEGDGLDAAIKNAVRRLNDAAAIPGVENTAYDVSSKTITITGNDANQDIVASKNAGRDSTIQILLGEMGEYMDEVEEITFSHEDAGLGVTDSITVKRDSHQATEEYIATLVDKWTDKLVYTVGNGKAVTYGQLNGEKLGVEATFMNGMTKDYTIQFYITE